jgi:hypothetical protein
MRTIPALILFYLMLFPNADASAASLTPDNFRYTAQIQGPIRKTVLYHVSLNSEIMQKCSRTCSDLRIFDSDNKEIPYVIIDHGQPDESVEIYPFEIMDYHDSAGFATVTMKLPEKHESIGEINVNTRSRDFKKTIVVYGSHDLKKWVLLAEDTIFDFSSQVDLRKTHIKFTGANYRYYKLKLLDIKNVVKKNESIRLRYNGLDFSIDGYEKGTLRIESIQGKTFPANEKVIFDGVVLTDLSSSVDDEHNTVIFFQTNLPFEKISFELSNLYYFRTAALYYSDSGKKDSYKPMTQGPIYQFPLSSAAIETRNYLENKQAEHNFYKMVIENKNSPPLEIKSIHLQWIRKTLYFIGLNDLPGYLLCIGNPNVEKPDYDLLKFINQSNWYKHAYEHLEISAIQQNTKFTPGIAKDKRARIEKTVLTLTVIFLVFIIGYWLYTLIKKADSKK